MSTILILLLFLLLAAPALAAFLRRDLGWKTGAFYGAVATALLAWHVGFSVGPMPDRAAFKLGPGAVLDADRCEQALAAAQRGGIVADRSDPNRLVVRRAIWDQLPDDVRGALTDCANSVRPADRRDQPVEIVNR
ncbi:MAG TPA: hypothetical protein VF702_11175 [Allosphingosinicella sp.]